VLLSAEARTQGLSVEWPYCFDVHCDAFFPVFVLLYVAQFFLIPVLAVRGVLATLLSSALYGAALVFYHYITFLGFSGACVCAWRLRVR
jgi:hypothetical protein